MAITTYFHTQIRPIDHNAAGLSFIVEVQLLRCQPPRSYCAFDLVSLLQHCNTHTYDEITTRLAVCKPAVHVVSGHLP